jgi:hypothetical protein
VEETVAVEMEAGVDIKSVDPGSGNLWMVDRLAQVSKVAN